ITIPAATEMLNRSRSNGATRERLENVTAEVLVFDDGRELLLYVCWIDLHNLFLQVRPFERDFVEQALHDGVEPARADVFRLLVYGRRELCNFHYGVIRKGNLDSFGFEQRRVLFDERVLRLAQNLDEVIHGQ